MGVWIRGVDKSQLTGKVGKVSAGQGQFILVVEHPQRGTGVMQDSCYSVRPTIPERLATQSRLEGRRTQKVLPRLDDSAGRTATQPQSI